jgi:streptogramin lyase
MQTPFGVLPKPGGGFYIADVDAHVVRFVDAGGVIDTVAGTGERGYSGDNGLGTAARLAGPSRMALDADGNLYICETKNHVIRRLAPNGIITTAFGTGERGYEGDNGPADAALLDTPYDITFAPNGDAYIADTGNNVIRRVNSSGVISTVVGLGIAGFGGDTGPGRDALLNRPSSVAFDESGAMWIADTSNHRIRRVAGFLGLQQ